ncbi:MAG: response regulator [Polaromonas sp.]|nr:response regulator [Polaromonas sp.]
MRQFSIRSLFRLSLVFLGLLPALLLGAVLLQRTSLLAEDLAARALQDTASRGQSDIQAHLQQAFRALDGLMPESKTSPQSVQALAWLSDPALFAPMAFALTRMSRDLRFIYYTSATGEVYGVENAAEGFRFGGRTAIDSGTRWFFSRQAKAPLKPEGVAGESPDPRSRSWYDAALQTRTRVFSPVTVYPTSKQLVVTLSQPVYQNITSAAAGVLGADLSLLPLSGLLRAQPVSPNGAAFLVNEAGFMLASTTADAMVTESSGKLLLRTPHSSVSPMISGIYMALEKQLAGASALRTAEAEKMTRLSLSDVPYFVTRRGVGDGMGLRWTLVVVAPESDFNAAFAASWRLLLACVATLLLLGIVATSLSARHVERFFRHLEQSVSRLRSGAVPPSVQRTPMRELGRLSRNLHDCAVLLTENNLQLLSEPTPNVADKQGVEALQNQLIARTTELAAARDRALTATRSKAAFLAVISHELRTPLNGVVGMSTLLANTSLSPEQRDYLQSLCVSSNQLQVVVDEILEFSRTESGEVVLQMAPMNVREVLENACNTAVVAARAKDLKLTVDVPGRILRADGTHASWLIEGDAARLSQILSQLVLNAVKFTESGSVTVKAVQRQAPGESGLPVLEVRVSDSGPGIAADQVRHVFTAFTQIDASTSRKHGGTGLGLATCKRLVELMGGRIGVESELGKGSTFWFTALAPWVDAAPNAPADTGLIQPVSSGLSQDTSRISILVVDDNLINLKVACAMLVKLGYNIQTAAGGREAINIVAAALARSEPLGAVLMDVHMPEVDGIQATLAIRAAHGVKAPPVIALTAGVSVDDRQRCLDAGMVEYLTKPLQVSLLARSLVRWAGGDLAVGPRATDVSPDLRNDFKRDAGTVPELARFERFSDADISMPAGLVDFDRLNDFKAFDDSQLSMTKEVIGLLFSEVPLQLAAIERAILKGDVGGLSSASHSLRGAASNVGAVTVQHLCSVLERGTLDAQAIPADASACLIALQIAWNKTRPLLENWR